MAVPYTMTRVQDVGIGATENIIQGLTGRSLVAPARVQIALNRENVNVSFTVLIGSERVMLNGAAAVQATAGVLPILPDDMYIDSFGRAGDEIIIDATNVDAAASEARAIVKVTELDDVALQRAMNAMQGA